MRINRFFVAVAVCSTFLFTACAGYTPTISRDEKPTANDAYLYGRFYIDSPSKKLALDGYQTMGFSIKCASDFPYIIRFTKEAPIQVIKIVPSKCSLKEFIYTNADGAVRSRKPAPEQLMHNVTFDPGKAYYLGDFFAEASESLLGNTIHMEWNIRRVKHDYDKTTSEMKTAYPNLSALPTEDRMLGQR